MHPALLPPPGRRRHPEAWSGSLGKGPEWPRQADPYLQAARLSCGVVLGGGHARPCCQPRAAPRSLLNLHIPSLPRQCPQSHPSAS